MNTEQERAQAAVRRHVNGPGAAVSGGLIRALREDLRLVTELLGKSSYTEQLGARLHVAAAELARLAGYQSVKAGQDSAAQRYYAAALRSAHAAGDRTVGANVLAFMAFHSTSFGDPRDAGAGALELGRAHDAEQHNRLAVATINPALAMDRMEYLAQLARARAAIGEVEHACQTAVEAVVAVGRQDSAYTRQQLTRFRADIAPHASNAAVQEFNTKFNDLLSV